MEYVAIKTIADKMTLDLSTYVDALYTAEVIDRKIKFSISDDINMYDDGVSFESDEEIPVVWGILNLVTGRMPTLSTGIYTEDYQITVTCKIDDRDLALQILDYYVRLQNTDKIFTIDSWTIYRSVEKPIFISKRDNFQGNKYETMSYSIRMSYSYNLNGISNTSPTVVIDGVSLDHIGLFYQNSKSMLPNISFGSNSNDKLVTEELRITFPIQTLNTKNMELLTAVLNNSYNKTYSINYTIAGISKVTSFVLRIGEIAYNRDNTMLSFTCIFYKALSRITMTIDGESVLVADYSIARDKEGVISMTPTSTLAKVTKQYTNTSVSIQLTIVDNGSTVFNKIASDIAVGNTSTYEIVTPVGGVSMTYNMVLKTGSIGVNETPNLTIQATFTEV